MLQSFILKVATALTSPRSQSEKEIRSPCTGNRIKNTTGCKSSTQVRFFI